MDIRTIYHSPIGEMLLLSDGDNLTGCYFKGQKHYPDDGAYELSNAPLPIFDSAKRWLDIYFSGQEPNFWVPIRFKGTQFQSKVWTTLLSIPYGEKRTYGQVAKMIGNDKSARAVAQAIGHNPISILIPCHRVVGASSLGGYAGGIERKEYLLKLENHLSK